MYASHKGEAVIDADLASRGGAAVGATLHVTSRTGERAVRVSGVASPGLPAQGALFVADSEVAAPDRARRLGGRGGGASAGPVDCGCAAPAGLPGRGVTRGAACGGVGYLLKDRVTALDDFLDAVERVAAGGTAMDPEVVRQLFSRNRGLETLTPREREVLGLMAQGLSNSAISAALVLAPVSVEKHIGSILTKLDLPPADDAHRRVRAVLTYLNG